MFTRLLCVAILLGIATYASAALVMHTSQSEFSATSTGLTTDTLSGLDTSGGSPGYTYYYGIQRADIAFQPATSGYGIYALTTGFGPTNTMPNGGTNLAPDAPNGMYMWLSSDITAVGFNIFKGNAAGNASLIVTLSDDSIESFTYLDASVASSATPTYVGFTNLLDELSIKKIQITGGGRIANVSYGTAVPTPEPSSITLICIGVVSLLAYAWRRRK